MSRRFVNEGTIVYAALKDLDAPYLGLSFAALYQSCTRLISARKGIHVLTEQEARSPSVPSLLRGRFDIFQAQRKRLPYYNKQ